MSAKHTPGPWNIRKGDLFLTVQDADGNSIAIPHSGPYVSAPNNARLIAAAPELLAALIELAPLWDMSAAQKYGDAMDRARTAITKAKGE